MFTNIPLAEASHNDQVQNQQNRERTFLFYWEALMGLMAERNYEELGVVIYCVTVVS